MIFSSVVIEPSVTGKALLFSYPIGRPISKIGDTVPSIIATENDTNINSAGEFGSAIASFYLTRMWWKADSSLESDLEWLRRGVSHSMFVANHLVLKGPLRPGIASGFRQSDGKFVWDLLKPLKIDRGDTFYGEVICHRRLALSRSVTVTFGFDGTRLDDTASMEV